MMFFWAQVHKTGSSSKGLLHWLNTSTAGFCRIGSQIVVKNMRTHIRQVMIDNITDFQIWACQ